jgi:hypothetical protein
MGMFFLSPEQQAAKDAEEAAEKARLEALYEANRNSGGIKYAPIGEKEQADINMAEQRKAKEKAEADRKMWAEMHQENIQWAKDNDLWNYEKNDFIPDPNYKKPEELGGAKRRAEEERKARELVYYNEERKGMASSGPGMSEFYNKFPDQKQTSYFAPENKATGDTRSWEEIKEDFVSGVDDGPVMHNPYMGDRLKYQDKVLKFMYGDAYTNREETGGSIGYNVMDVPDYYTNQYRVPYDSPEGKDFVIDFPKDIEGAKAQADDFYIESLTRSLEKATTNQERAEIQSLINRGAPTFNTREDFQLYYDLGVDVYQNKKELLDSGVAEADIPFSVNSELKDALQIQEDVMANWVYFGDGRNSWVVNDSAHLFFKESEGVEFEAFKEGDAYLNTGTGFTRGSLESLLEDPDFQVGVIKGKSYWVKPPEVKQMSTFQKNMGIVMDIASIVYPPAAPFLQGMKALQQGGDLEDAAKAGGMAYLGNKVGDIVFDDVVKAFDDIGIPISELSEVQQKVIVDTTIDGLEGKSIQDSLEKNAGKALVKGGADAIGEMLSDIDIEIGGNFETPEWLEKAGDVVVAAGTAIGNAVEPVVKPIYEGVKAAGDVVEPIAKDIVDVGQQAVDVVQEAVQPISDFTSDIEDDILDAGRAFDDTVIDPIDDVVDTFGSEVVDPALQAGSDVLSDAEDVVSDVLSEGEDILKEGGRRLDDLINWEGLVKGMLAGNMGGASGGQRSQFMPTETEGLFSKELFKLKTKIEDPDSAFNPTTKLRKYG